MTNTIWTIAHNKITEFHRKKLIWFFPIILLLCFFLPMWLKVEFDKNMFDSVCSHDCLKKWIDDCYTLSFALEYIVLYFVAAYSLHREIESKSIITLMLTSTSRLKFLSGKIVGCLIIHCIFIILILLSHFILSFFFKLPLIGSFYLLEFIEHLYMGCIAFLLLIGLSLVVPSFVSIILMMIIFLIPAYIENFNTDFNRVFSTIKWGLYYVTPFETKQTLFEILSSSASTKEVVQQLLIRIELLMYSIYVFMGCMQLTRNYEMHLRD